ncbi:uncharacterized protein BCR38DRAFT_308125, partial [Pseudomassariella vexata]
GNNVNNSPPGHGFRRAVTVDEGVQLRRRSTINAATSENPLGEIRRRSSSFSDYSLNEARRNLESSADELFNLRGARTQSGDKSLYASVPLIFALLPAVGGMLFKNGSAFLTDVILLGLAAIFLHWSVTQPWSWYHAAQEVRVVKDEVMAGSVFESDSELELSTSASVTTALENVPEENGKEREKEKVKQAENVKKPETPQNSPKPAHRQWEVRRAGTAKELYIHEMLALVGCFLFPLLGAYLLHTIRGQLSRPSEGLVSDYNLSIFLIAAEVRPISHLIKLVQNRTLRIQRLVATNPYQRHAIRTKQLQELHGRLDELETRAAAVEVSSSASVQTDLLSSRVMEATLARNVRDGMQPELDALNRAVRRYEKKLALLAGQIDTRLEYLDGRLNDAIALAAVAAKHSNAQGNLGSWLVETTVTIVMFPIQTAISVLTFPFRTVSSLLGRKSRPSSEKSHRTSRNGRPSGSSRAGSDRVPTRMSRR